MKSLKLFGKELFGIKKELLPELYDFAQHGLVRSTNHLGVDITTYTTKFENDLSNDSEKPIKEKLTKTPKEIYELETLHDNKYSINCDISYIDKNIKSLSKKLKLLPDPDAKKRSRRDSHGADSEQQIFVDSYGASKAGRQEMQSVIDRLNNRKQYNKYKDFFDQYPYTRSELISNLLEEHENLLSKRVEEFIPDLPDDAINQMNAYNNKVIELTGMKAVFYIIADRSDFSEVYKKRDPILLAQSPFALSWQILGAWDEEMIYLGDL